ncbi:hypothetical protein N24_1865 [Corynebacterium suranareeae]|uniref:Uncharacterized protein n=1 Tax=Corynebacterium suranareeae TaxID=2506452 RepID=A0A160PPZ9_9CORY|nr:hypothetical protein [Corynebacterium suranareeae]BAU96127.1 hypothetical protein N24_1865 [Corynebacterium suranareeae]
MTTPDPTNRDTQELMGVPKTQVRLGEGGMDANGVLNSVDQQLRMRQRYQAMNQEEQPVIQEEAQVQQQNDGFSFG